MTLIGTTTFTSTLATGGSQNISVAWPAGVADGDLAVLMFAQERGVVFPDLATMLPGWTTYLNNDTSAAVLVATKYVVPADITSPVAIGTLTSARRCVGAIQVHRAAGAPTVQAGAIVAAGGSAPAVTTPAVTASAANGVVISVFGFRSSGVGSSSGGWTRSVVPAGGYTEDLDVSTTAAATANAALHISRKTVTTSGAQATASHTMADNNTQVIPFAIYIPDGNTRLATPVPVLGTKTNVTVPGGSDGTQQISWPAVANAGSYKVEIAPGAAATTGFVVKSTTAVSPYTVTGLAAGTYTIAVTAVP